MKQRLRISLILGLLIFVLAVRTTAGDYGDNAACEACIDSANAAYEACVAEWPGDPDCESKRQRALQFCEGTYCIY